MDYTVEDIKTKAESLGFSEWDEYNGAVYGEMIHKLTQEKIHIEIRLNGNVVCLVPDNGFDTEGILDFADFMVIENIRVVPSIVVETDKFTYSI